MEQHGRIDWSICNAQIAKGNVMQPMNYTIQTPKSGELLSGALTMAGQMAQRDQFLANADKARAEQQRIEAETAAAEQKRQELFALAQNPNRTSKDFENFMLRHGEINKQFQDQFQGMQESEQRQSVAVMSLVREGLKNKRPDVVVSELDRQIEAAKNSNNQAMADKLDMVRNMVLADPNAADLSANFFLRANMDPVKYEEMVGKRGAEERAQELQPSAVRKSEADATTAEAKAKYAEPQILADMQEQGWKIEGIKADINFKRQSTQIAAMQAALAREGNDLKRVELQQKIDGKQSEIEQKARETQVQVSEATSTIDDMLRTLDQIEKNPQLGRVVGIIGGRVNSAPLNNDALNAVALIDSFSSQAFMTQREKLKGGGSITDFEGQKAADALANLTRKQSKDQFLATIKDARRKLLRGRSQIEEKYGVPRTVPDTPTAGGGVGGKTVEQILDELGVGR
jgi:hypothetical protein